ncbi:RNA polymerase sigma factor, sigma-70 family [Micromonospora phaseoli]|uniref:RNA polymerase sigma factor, sigma-70 family n=1 Tax=Micromonospora phaseoli TaxID=1144548 RepID=A0A1H6YIB3_9ACTN|nr:sigma-70 family RNA polymerase sigma factor [Micromonospora phaseoli]PZW00218.1 RNA polymerase sigma factor (sigma-70 family) [Micromonospora phaseoli]GIJ78925.1 RNA polymerase sigma24 factor [Micromonospora phaseoli]SEJ41019.1 RNA polymerase sigma factor, sigma-70 family [Micromonospora phaseoli]
MGEPAVEDLLRRLAPQVLGALVRRYGHFDTAEDATQEALIAAATGWPRDGVPDNPRAWLITVAARRLTDLLRAEQARRRREDTAGRWLLAEWRLLPATDRAADADDTLILLLLCCHPALPPASQIALTLRAVGGLSTIEVARAFLVPQETMTRRISRGKQRIRESGLPFAMPAPAELPARLAVVLRVLYLIFNEGYASTSGPGLLRADLCAEAIRLTRLLHRMLADGTAASPDGTAASPDGTAASPDGTAASPAGVRPDAPAATPGAEEVTGLLALLLLTDARAPARTGPHGELVPMAEQDRSRWRADQIAEGVALVADVLPRGRPGPYQVQAAIAALHDEAPSAEQTDWPQIVALYGVLRQLDGNPLVALNHAVAVAMTEGPDAGLALVDRVTADGRLARDPRLPAVRAHLLERRGDAVAARAEYRVAAARSTNLAQQRYLNARADRLPAD